MHAVPVVCLKAYEDAEQQRKARECIDFGKVKRQVDSSLVWRMSGWSGGVEVLRRTDFSLYCRHKYQYVNASLQRYKLTLTVTHTAPPPPPPLQVCQRAEVIAQNASPPWPRTCSASKPCWSGSNTTSSSGLRSLTAQRQVGVLLVLVLMVLL